ncbi:MAG: hypothetical protein JW996_03750 [Candidatus Cloacimonetes bacterium]|nr:hypothetical protein [Candidatus Cloacimonadota bacterium]
MDYIKTDDGSFTLYDQSFQEHFHSLSGALEEALEKHVNAIGVIDGFRILDFCFGLGYNSIAATVNHNHLEIIGLEKNLEIVKLIRDLEVPTSIKPQFDPFRYIAEKLIITDLNNNTIKLIIGDALQTIDQLSADYFDRVFFDPFSPRKQPEMWSLEIFRKVNDKMKSNGRLSTYSCTKWIRDNMMKAGFTVFDGPAVGRKSPATIGVKTPKT